MKTAAFIMSFSLAIGIAGSVVASPPGSCTPWPECKGGDDDSSGPGDFFEACGDLGRWTVGVDQGVDQAAELVEFDVDRRVGDAPEAFLSRLVGLAGSDHVPLQGHAVVGQARHHQVP